MRLVIVLAFIFLQAVSAWADDSSYRLQTGDILDVSVYQEEGLQKQVRIAPDGTISFPLVGHVRVRGRTAGEVESILTAKLGSYITNPVVNVSIAGLASDRERPATEEEIETQRIFVTGQVRNPGMFEVTEPTTVMQALSVAGGLSEFAAHRRIKVLRETREGQIVLEFDYTSVAKGWDMSSNILLIDGDVVVVPERGLFGGLFE